MERERVAVDVLIVVPQPGSDPESTALKHPLARYAVAQRVQNSRFGPHNGLTDRIDGLSDRAGRGLNTTRIARVYRCLARYPLCHCM
jgi:hypothetical protein